MAPFIFDTYFRTEKTSHVEMDREHLSVRYERYTDKKTGGEMPLEAKFRKMTPQPFAILRRLSFLRF